ncbi:MAG: SPFH domain-containing protein [Candidatus Altiarchaeota archaeon]
MALLQLFIFFFLILTIVLVFLVVRNIKVIRPFERGIIERFGKYKKTVDQGIVFVLPFIEKLYVVDIRERIIDVPPQEVITKDNATVIADAVIYFRIFDPKKSIYNIENFSLATSMLAQTALRNTIGAMDLDQTLSSRDSINLTLTQTLEKVTDEWGLKITKVEIKKIEPPKDIADAMTKQMKAERMRRAAILEAEGFKQAAILKAEGEKQAAILEAEGKSKAIHMVYDAIHRGVPTNDLIAVKYLETLEKIADGKATKIFLPIETSSILGSIAKIREIFSEK